MSTHAHINVCVCDSTSSSPGFAEHFLLRAGAQHRYELLKGRKGFSAETVCFVERYKVTAFSIIKTFPVQNFLNPQPSEKIKADDSCGD